MSRSLRLPAALLALSLVIAACSREPEPVSGSLTGTITRTAPAEGATVTTAAAPELAPIIPGQAFVVFAEGRPETTLGTTAVGEFRFGADGGFSFQGEGFELLSSYPLPGISLALYSFDGLNEAETFEMIAALRASDQVKTALPNWVLSANEVVPDDTLYALQDWHYRQLNLPAAWEIETGETSQVTVAVLDTGRYDHADIDWAPIGANFVTDPVTGMPDPAEGGIDNPWTIPGGSDHGTHVAGTIGALSNNAAGVAGVNWNSELVPVKVLGQYGSGGFGGILTGLLWAAGIPDPAFGEHMIANPAQVINMSLGGNIMETCPPELDEIFATLAGLGTITVVAAGNEASPADVSFPASCPSVITVGATGLTGDRAYYSNYGPFVDVMAPGGDLDYSHPADETLPALILSTVAADGYDFNQGTSMAAPHVTGVVSLLLAQEPGLQLEQVRERLHNASQPLSLDQCNVPASGLDGQNVCGAGLLDAEAALLGITLTTPSAVAYAISYEGEEAPELALGNLSSLEHLASHRSEGVLMASGDYSFEFPELDAGTYLVVGLELRDAAAGISNVDRAGFTASVTVELGEVTETTVVTEPIWLSLR